MRYVFPDQEPAMRRPEDDYSPEENQQRRETMEPLRESQIASKQKAQQVYEEMKQRDPEFWKAFGFATEKEYLWYYDLDDFIHIHP